MQFEQLISKLAPETKNLLEQSVATASSRSHFAVELDHLIHQLASNPSPLDRDLLEATGCDCLALMNQSEQVLESLKTGNDGFPKISPDIAKLLFDAWMIATSEYQTTTIIAGHIVLSLLENEANRVRFGQHYPALLEINVNTLQNELAKQIQTTESYSSPQSNNTTGGQQPNLNQYTINLTQQARDGKIESIVGRDNEVRQMIDILSRKKQNNPILTGEAGVGKTAVVEGLALKIVNKQVPESLQSVELHSLDLGLLQAGAGVKGEFENRLKGVIKEVNASITPIILFIDEAHTLIGSGNNSGAGDAANLLKPALARGELRTIAATTWSEYKQYFESDAALTRRFQVVKVEEPSPTVAIDMLRHIAPNLESHHQVVILDSAIQAAVNLSHRYISGRQLPDKSVSLLDTACARVSLSLSTEPADIETRRASLANIQTELLRLNSEAKSGYNHEHKLQELKATQQCLEEELAQLNAQWHEEQSIIQQIIELHQQTREPITHASGDEKENINNNSRDAISTLKSLRDNLQQLNKDRPLMFECVTEDIIAQVVTDWTGIPVSKINNDEAQNVLKLRDTLEQRVIGQSHALDLIASAVKTSRAGLSDPNRPVGVFMLVGPSGVGKTETALALAEQLYGSDRLINVINMSEFKEEHKVSMLLGAPPGYVGYGKGGVLTEAIRRNPYSVLLLDEIEKAHPGVHDIFYQVFDKGIIKDGEGRDIDFKNTVILMTSNCASEEITQLCEDPDTAPEPDQLLEAINPTLRNTFKTAFLGRINLIPYYPLNNKNLITISQLKLNTIRKRFKNSYQSELDFNENFYEWINNRCNQGDIGARQIDLLINNTFLPKLSEIMLNKVLETNTFEQLSVNINDKNDLEFNFT